MDFVKRPVAVFTLSLFASFCLLLNFGVISEMAVFAISLFLFIASLVIVIVSKKKIRVLFSYAAIVALAIVVSSLYAFFFTSDSDVSSLYDGEHEIVFCVTDELGGSENYHSYTADVIRVDDGKADFKTVISGVNVFEIGEIVRAKSEFYIPESDAVFDEEKYCLSLGVRVKCEIEEASVIGENTDSLLIKIRKLNGRLSSIFYEGLEGEAANIADAIVLGNKSELSNSVRRDFSRLGISHLLAISGMHISFISAGFSFLMKKAGVRKKIICLLTVFLMIFYMALTGFSPSVVRAAVLCIMMSIIYIIGISYDGITCLGVCGCIMIFVDPFCAYSVGMQLSFCAYLGCLASSGAIGRLGLGKKTREDRIIKRLAKSVCRTLVFSLFAVLFTLPVSWFYFDSTSVIAPLTNLFFIPAFSLVLYISVVLLAVYPISPVFLFLSKVAAFIINFPLEIASRISSIRGISISTKYPFSPYIFALLALAVIAAALIKKKHVFVAWISIAVLIASYACGVLIYNLNLEGEVEVTRCGGKSGETLIVLSDGECAAIMLSPASHTEIKRAIHYAGERRVTEVDTLILTRYTSKSLDGVKYFDESTVLETVYLPSPDKDSYSIYSSIKEYIENSGKKAVKYSVNNDKIQFAASSISVFSFENDASSVRTVCVEVTGEKQQLAYLGKGWSSSKSKVISRIPPSSCEYIFFGSYGSKITSPYTVGNYGGELYLFAEADNNTERYVSFIPYEDRYSVSDTATVRLK